MTFECPDCGKEFENKQSKTVHLGWCRKRDGHSEETKRKMSEAAKGRTHSEETKKKISETLQGRNHSEEAKKKMSKKQQGRKMKEKTKEKISKTLEGHSYGTDWSHTEEAKKKMSETHKGKKMSEKTKKKISEGTKGRDLKEKTKKKISETLKKNWKDEEFRQKMFEKMDYSGQTKLERKAENIVGELSLDFKFVGDFSYRIGKKCPDFINEEEKVAIEVYSISEKKWRKDLDSIDEYKEPRRKYFNDRGWKVHFIPAKTLKEDLEELA